jgi:crotonobetainyl-CoA:carnitine CoA-transferase CaiB-like acyl-CoA transferase
MIKRLCREADVIIENNLPGALQRSGLGYEALARENPGLIYATISGYGLRTSISHYPAYGPATEGRTGLEWWIRDSRSPHEPLPTGMGYPDVAIAMQAATGIITALLRRKETGLGGFLDLSQIDATLFVQSELLYRWQAAPTDTRTWQVGQPQNLSTIPLVPEADLWCVARKNDLPGIVAALAGSYDHPAAPCAHCPAGRLPEEQVLMHTAQLQGAERIMVWLRDRGFDCALVRDPAHVYTSPQLEDFWTTISHPDIGTYRYDNTPVSWNGTRRAPTTFPGLGEHNHAVVGSWLGACDGEVDALEASGAFATMPPA